MLNNPIVADNQVEISLFGPGAGECILIGIGRNNWYCVDSCIPRGESSPVALSYLHSQGIDVADSLKKIIVTHWHDDHIRGIADVYKQATNARLIISPFVKERDFIPLLKTYGSNTDTTIGTREILELLFLQEKRDKDFSLAIMNRTLDNSQLNISGFIIDTRIISYSPTDRYTNACLKELGKLLASLPSSDLSFNLPDPNINFSSIVLFVEIGNFRVLLGSDMSVDSNGLGWATIIDDPVIKRNPRSDIYKVAHHGSVKSDSSRIWTELLNSNPKCILTPFTRGKNIVPNRKGIENIREKTTDAFISSYTKSNGKKRRQNEIQSTLTDFGIKPKYAFPKCGHIRLRSTIEGDNKLSDWTIELSPEARKLSSIIFDPE
jgi:hypothetical protein